MDLMPHFGFHTTPFTREIDTRDLFPLPHLQDALDGLRNAIEHRMLAVLLAASGQGKTVVLRRLREELPEARYRVRYIKVTSLSKRDMCREIAAACGLPPAGTYPSLVRKLQQHWEDGLTHEGVRSVLILDEAHDLRPDVLGILRILTNYDYDSQLVLSIVLSGQGGLQNMLTRDDMQAVARRMAHVATLRLLTRNETRQYIQHRCIAAGRADAPFDHAALESIFEQTRGNFRAIDRLALKSLHLTAMQEHDAVGAAQVAQARKQLLI